jgi:hypothetical protein
MGNCCSKELVFNDERNNNSLYILHNENVMKHIGLTPFDYYLTHDKNNKLLTSL